MNPNVERMPLPEMKLPGAGQEAGYDDATANAAPRPERVGSGQPPAQQFVVPLPTTPPMQTSTSSVQQVNSQVQSNTSAPAQPQDEASLDKEYVNKAKLIIEQTKNDPFIRTNEIGKVKAEFLKRKYGKEIRQSEE